MRPIFERESWGTAVAFDGDKIVLVGTLASPWALFVTRLTADGELDVTFGTSGVTIIEGLMPSGVEMIQRKAIVVGRLPDSNRAFAVRLNQDGTLDSHFALTGRAEFGVGGAIELARARDCGFAVTSQSRLFLFDQSGNANPSFGGGSGSVALGSADSWNLAVTPVGFATAGGRDGRIGILLRRRSRGAWAS